LPLRVAPENEVDFLREVPLTELPIDVKSKQRLQRLGLTKLKEIVNVDARRFSRSFREVVQSLQQFALGNDGSPVQPLWPPPSLTETFIFEEVAPAWDRIEAALKNRSARLSDALLRDRQYCRVMKLTLVLEDEKPISLSEKLVAPSSTEGQIYRGARRLLRRIYDDHAKGCSLEEHTFPVLSFTLECAGIDIGSGIQQTLLDVYGNALPDERRRALDSTLGFARGRWGAKAVVDASAYLSGGQRSFYTGTLGSRLNEKVTVEEVDDQPCRFRRKEHGTVPIIDIVDRWHERRWNCGVEIDRWFYQVQTPGGLAELCRIEKNEWQLKGVAD